MKQKREEQDRKRKEILDNKRAAEKKVADGATPKNKKEDDTDDPIAKSLKERMAAGTITSVVSKPGQKPSTSLPARTPMPSKPKTGLKKENDSESTTPKASANKIGAPRPSTTGLSKPATAAPGRKGKDMPDDDDPIETSLKLRVEKGGMITAVVKDGSKPVVKPTVTRPMTTRPPTTKDSAKDLGKDEKENKDAGKPKPATTTARPSMLNKGPSTKPGK
jgi:hypothetical protein